MAHENHPTHIERRRQDALPSTDTALAHTAKLPLPCRNSEAPTSPAWFPPAQTDRLARRHRACAAPDPPDVVGYLALDRSGRILAVNKITIEILGTDGDRCVGLPLSAFLARSQLPQLVRHLEHVFARTATVSTALVIRRDKGPPVAVRLDTVADGSAESHLCHTDMVTIEESATPCVLYQRAYDGLNATVLAHTEELEEVHASLRESHNRLRAFLDNIPAPVYVKDPTGQYLLINRACEALLGCRSQDACGRTDQSFFSAETAEQFATHDRHVYETGRPMEYEETVAQPDGRRSYVSTKFPLLGSGGAPYAVCGISIDITERKRAEQALRASEARLAHAQALAHIGSWELTPETGQCLWSDEVFRIFGRPPQSFNPSYDLFLEAIHPDDRSSIHEWLNDAQTDDTQTSIEFRIQTPDGSSRTLCCQGAVLPPSDGSALKISGTIQDITERYRTEARLRQAAAVFDNTDQGIMITDAGQHIIAVNRAFTTITGYSPAEVLGKTPSFFHSARHDVDFYKALWQSVIQQGHWQGEIWNRVSNGQVRALWESISTVRDVNDRVTNYLSVFSDISSLKQTEAHLHHLAHHDPLTGLPNRLLLDARLESAMQAAARRGRKTGLLFMDLDRFKLINDTLGHKVGDLLLQRIAHRLERCVRAEDTVARLGGDEFALVLTDIDHAEQAARLAEKIANATSPPVPLDGLEVTTDVSIGIAIFPDDAKTSRDLYNAADAALYLAKHRGRGQYQFYTPELTSRALNRLALEQDLRQALDREEFLLHYQPQLSLLTGRLVGVEALLRWQHPTLGMLLPEKFLAAAEDTGLIDKITGWVLQRACSFAAQWRVSDRAPLRVSINVSARTLLRTPGLVENVKVALATTGLPANLLELEVTEQALQTHPKSIDTLAGLKRLGVMLAIDDFGTGYSCLSSLKLLPIDALKIDKSFITGIPADGDSSAIAAAIIAMGHRLNLRIVAEGVAEEDQLRFLQDNDCEEIQGYYFSRPVPEDMVEQLAATDDRR